MRKLITRALIFGVVIPAVLMGAGGCRNAETLAPAEVREYQGEKLSSVNDFRENSIDGPQHVDIAGYRLKVSGLVKSPRSYTYDEVVNKHRLYKKVVTLNCVEGWSVTILWEGLLVKDLIAEAGALPGARVVIFHAYDGYTSSLPVDYLVNSNILISHKMNDITIPPERGFPFHLVAESKWGYKWVKWLTEIELSDDVNYEGYWESRGYSSSGDLKRE